AMRKNPSDHNPVAKQTRPLRAGSGAAPAAKTVSPPLQRGSTVLLPNARALYDTSAPTYGRLGLSMQTALAEAVGELEGSGPARLFPSGLAAVTGTLLALLKAGDEILVTDCVYGPSRRFCEGLLKRYGVRTRYFAADAAPDTVMGMVGPDTRLILLESPGSLTFEIQDVPAIARLARERGVLTVIDNTWGAGLLYNPLSLGVDVSVQALTKYVGGHSDVFMGAACSLDDRMLGRIDAFLRDFGLGVSPDDAYFMLRGMRTLEVRLRRHGENALKVAQWLQGQGEVARVLCPALPGAPGHMLWKRDFSGLNGLFGLVLQSGPEAAVEAFIDSLQLFGLGFSWGGFESLAIHCDPQLAFRPQAPALGGPLVRLHVGLEDPDDLIADLRRALDAYAAALD
ncbi:MAG: metC, partial [Caulobacteraceae bacterium]|nr:metC [Caulobacteraceae bacterium]